MCIQNTVLDLITSYAPISAYCILFVLFKQVLYELLVFSQSGDLISFSHRIGGNQKC